MSQNGKQTLEHYVAARYVQEIAQANYQPPFEDAEDMLYDAMHVMAMLNRASQTFKTKVNPKPI